APENAKLLAARGRPEQALAAHRRALAASDPSLEPALRQELAEGFLLGGEPARALPFVHDLPLLRARALLDLGRVGEASAELGRIDPAGYEGTLPDLERMRAYIAYSMGRLEEAERIARPLIDQEAGEEAMVTHGLVLAQLGRPDQAASILTEALSRLDEQRRPYLRAAALTNLAEVDRHRNRLEEARGSHVEAMRLYQSLGNVRYTATASSNLGVIAKDLGEFEEALIHQRRARSLFAHLADEKGVAVAEANLGILNLESGDPRSAVKRLESAYAELERLEAREPLPLVSVMLARGHALLGDTAEALKWLGGAEPLTTIRLQEEAEKVRKLLRAARTDATEARADMIQGEPTPARGVIDATVPKAVFRTFLAVNRRLASDADLDSAMSSLLEAAVTLTGGRLGYFLVVRPNGVRQEFRTDTGTEAGISFSRSLVNRSIQRGQTLTEQDAIADEDLMSMPSVRGLRVRSAICAPFVCASGTRGALYVEHPGRSGVFGDAEKEQLEVLSDQASIAVERMLHEE
ncbi:MAG: tetratricopeptide repeat protein, partial [Planctomycetota bacterium]